MKDSKNITEILPLYRGKLTVTKGSNKIKQEVWVGWVNYYEDGSTETLITGEFKTLKELKDKGDLPK
tara:strand:+ start:4158 stop:4358 length:201 start_codon:yes stop_codon:yes gene_type:complete